MKKYYLLLSLIILLVFNIASAEKLAAISFGPVNLGASRMPINLKNFIIHKNKLSVKTSARFIPDSVQWIRTESNLLVPRAKLEITVYHSKPNIHLKHQEKVIIPEQNQNFFRAILYISLFQPGEIFVIVGGKSVGNIYIRSIPPKNQKHTHLIDYSCAKYHLKIKGLDGNYISVGCRLVRDGNFGSEVPRLEVYWASTNLRLLDRSPPPYTTIITKSGPASTTVIDQNGNRKVIIIEAKLPKRLHRLNFAYGFGPYPFRVKQGDRARSAKIAPAAMLYGNLNLGRGSSIRGFDALIWQESLFNNFGLYFAYEIAEILDNRVQIVPLLGIQGLTFKYNNNFKATTKFIYPQGGEIWYRHAFGLKNYHFFYGIFKSLGDPDYDYINTWIRFGKNVFWELNYISWDDRTRHASMWGISIGLPLASFF